jgi:hypothetical protein
VLCASCASPSQRAGELRDTDAALSRALTAGAEDRAPRDLALAREKLSLAQRYFERGEIRFASWLLEQARVDADLAAVRSADAAEPAR